MQMKRVYLPIRGKIHNILSGALVFGGWLCGCTTPGGYVPPEAINPPAGEFTRAIATFATDTKKDYLTPYRRNLRQDIFIATVVNYVETPTTDAVTLKALLRDLIKKQPANFLCSPRFAYQKNVLYVGNIEAVGTALGDRLQAPSTEIGALFASLGTNYAISVAVKAIPKNYDEWSKSSAGTQCSGAISSGDQFATRPNPGDEIAVAAAVTALDAIWTVIKPVIVGTLQTVDLERRAAAVRAYFSDQKNVDTLKSELASVENYLSSEFVLAQRRTAGRAVAASNILFNPAAPHWTKMTEIARTARCQSGLAARLKDKSAADGVSCMIEILAVADGPLGVALDAADAFDAASEQQLPDAANRLSAQVDTLREIAVGNQPDEAKVKALWAAASRYVTLFKSYQDVTSAANKKKIADAVAEFLKAMK